MRLFRCLGQKRHQPDHRRRGGQEDRPEPAHAGILDCIGDGQPRLARLVVAGQHDEAVIDDDTRQRQHAEEGQDRQRQVHDDVAEGCQ